VIAPDGVPVAAVAVAERVTLAVTTTGLGEATNTMVAGCLTTWINAGETLAASELSPA